jgi:dephospho-CoA kinase
VTVVIGLTGPIGCGKTTVAGWLAELGAAVVDADRLARDVVEPGEPAFSAVVDAFGPDVLAPDGGLDRAALGRRVFADPVQLGRLEAIVHPAVRPRIEAAVAAAEARAARAIVVEAIKLVEGGYAALCDEVWLVTCDPGVQRHRLATRSLPAADLDARIGAQGDVTGRLLPASSLVLDTSSDAEATRRRVASAYAEALGRAASG